MKRRLKVEETFFRVMMNLSTAFILLILGVIIYSVFEKGMKAISWEMLTSIPSGGYYYGKGGGILNAIVGSMTLAFGATILAFLIGLPVALYINVFLHGKKKLVNLIRFILDLIWGIPSIVYGAFGFTLMVLVGLQTSLLAGIITVTLFILPIMIRSMMRYCALFLPGLWRLLTLSAAINRSWRLKYLPGNPYRELSRLCFFHSAVQ